MSVRYIPATRTTPAWVGPWKRPLKVYLKVAAFPATTPCTVETPLKSPFGPIGISAITSVLFRFPVGEQRTAVGTLTDWTCALLTANEKFVFCGESPV